MAAKARRHLAAGAALSLVAQAGPLVAGAAMSVVLARTVGPSGNGVISLVTTLIGIVTLVVSLGLTGGLTYEVSSGRLRVQRAIRSAYLAGLGLGVVGIAGGAAFWALERDGAFDGVSATVISIALASVPAFLSYQFASAIALGADRYETYTSLELVHAAVMLIGAAGLAVPFGVEGAVVGIAASGCAAALLGWWSLGRGSAGPAPPEEPDAMRRATRFGVQSWLANLLQQVNYRFDVLILGAFATTSTVGVYSVALTVASVGFVLPQALQVVVFPRTASLAAGAATGELTAEEADESVARVVRHTMVLLLPTALVVAVLLVVAVPLLYGSAFSTTTALGFVLLPGVLALGLGKVLISVVAGRGHPRYALYAGLIVVPVTLALYFLLIPRWDAWGAASASSISYAATAVVCLVFFRRVTGIGLRAALMPRRADLRDYRDAMVALRGRFRRPVP